MSATKAAANYIVWDVDKSVKGPMDLPTLISWVQGGLIVAETWVYVCKRGVWERAAKLPELGSQFNPPWPNLVGKVDDGAEGIEINLHTLRRHRLLSYFKDEQIERFTRYMVAERFPQASVVVKQGDRGNAMYLIIEGELSVFMNVCNLETEIATLSPGDFFGELVLFDHGPRSANVVANCTCLLLKISLESFQQLSREAPDLAVSFLRAIGKSLTVRIRAGNKHRGEALLMSQMV